MDKKNARNAGLHARRSLAEEERRIQEEDCFSRLLPFLNHAETIGCYVSMKDEMDTYRILNWCLEHQKILGVPVTTGKTLVFRSIKSLSDLKKGAFGVMEPQDGEMIAPEDFDLMIVPLSSFDDEGHRTGYGRGYYDSILAKCHLKAGIAFAEQKVDSIETDPWDVTLDLIIYRTEEKQSA